MRLPEIGSGQLKATLFLVIGLFALVVFFIPPEFFEIYLELCKTWRFLIHFDKVFHFIFFISITLFFSCRNNNFYEEMKILLFLMVLGISIEIMQSFTPNRSASFHDMVANMSGIFYGTIFKFKNSRMRLFQN